MLRKCTCAGIGIVSVMAGCAAPRSDRIPGPRSWGSDIPSFKASVDNVEKPAKPAGVETGETITLQKALTLALMNNPELAAASWEARAAAARVVQAGRRTNPELELEAEELGTDGGTDEALVSAALSSEFDLWNKRGKQVKAAQLEAGLAGWDHEATRLAVLADTTKAFMSLLAARERVRLAEEQYRLSQEVHRIAVGRVKGGKVPKLEQTKAEVNLVTGKLGLERSRNDLENERERLAALWGSTVATFGRADGDLDAVLQDIPSLDKVMAHIAQNPEYARQDQEIELREVSLSMEKADRLPEVSAGAKVENSRAESETTLGVGLAVSLPIFDRRQGGIAEANCELAKARQERRAAKIALRLELTQIHRTLCAAVRQVDALRDKALPAARQALDAATKGYELGKYELLDVLDAQGTLFETEEIYVDTLVEYHDAVADLQRLIGCRIDGEGSVESSTKK